MATGTVKWFNGAKGYGFITPDEGSELVFAHSSGVRMEEEAPLQEGQRVTFEVTYKAKGPMASNIRIAE